MARDDSWLRPTNEYRSDIESGDMASFDAWLHRKTPQEGHDEALARRLEGHLASVNAAAESEVDRYLQGKTPRKG